MMAKKEKLSTDEFLANEFVETRLSRFKKLAVKVRQLVLEIVQYYLSICYPFDEEASSICMDITRSKEQKNETQMAECYQRFLEFLPLRLRSGIQGRNLFKQPSETDLMLVNSNFYANDLETIKEFNTSLFERDESGMNNKEKLRLVEYYLEKELGIDHSDVQPER